MMKLILFFTLLFYVTFPKIVSAQVRDIATDLRTLKKSSWTDGFEFVKYNTPQEAKEIWNIDVSDKNTMILIGGTLHEGGTVLLLKYNKHFIWVDKKKQYQMFPSGNQISFDNYRRIIIVKDPLNGTINGILKPIFQADPLVGLKEMTIRNIRRLGFSGTYKDETGKMYKFYPEENKTEGLPVDIQKYSLAEIYDFPNPIMVFSDKAYGVNKTPQGVELIEVRIVEEDDFYEPVPNGERLSLKRLLDPMECEYPLLSEEYFTTQELIWYGGNPYSYTGDTDIKAGLKQLLNTLSIMRNEIFARHGYIFKSAKWRNYFKSKQWYRPSKTNITSELSEIEKVNIKILQLEEKNIKKQLSETE